MTDNLPGMILNLDANKENMSKVCPQAETIWQITDLFIYRKLIGKYFLAFQAEMPNIT